MATQEQIAAAWERVENKADFSRGRIETPLLPPEPFDPAKTYRPDDIFEIVTFTQHNKLTIPPQPYVLGSCNGVHVEISTER